jgi:hypothetical protein
VLRHINVVMLSLQLYIHSASILLRLRYLSH